MNSGLQTRGINVRPHKRSTEGSPPAGLKISSAYRLEGSPGRPLRGNRDSDFGLKTRRTRRTRTARHVKVTGNKRSPEQVLASLETEHAALIVDVAARKAQGLDYSNVSAQARGLKARMDRMRGQVFVSSADVDLGSASWQTDNA